jgi:hypothetical protein
MNTDGYGGSMKHTEDSLYLSHYYGLPKSDVDDMVMCHGNKVTVLLLEGAKKRAEMMVRMVVC